jgi:two-component sensor histidine kinase
MLAHLGQRAPRLEVKTDMMKIPLEQAISLALLTNELISNAIKHAFPPGVTGTIRVSFKALPDGASELIVADNGSGMPPNFDAANSKTLGMALIQRLMKSLSARIWIRSNKDGTEVSVALPPRPPPPA